MPVVRPYRAQQQIQPVQTPQRGRVPIGQLQTPILNVNPTPAAFGYAAGETVRALGAQAFSQELQIQDQRRQLAKAQQDRVRILEADRQLSDWENRTLYDPENGALNTRGKQAFGLPETISQEFEKTYGDIWQGLSNDQQRQAFDQLAQSRRSDVQSTIFRHVSKEMDTFEATEQAQYLDNSRQAAAANALDPVRVGTEIQRQRIAISSFADAHGLGPEWSKGETAKAVSQTRVDVLNAMLATGHDLEASGYFNEHKDDILGTARAPIERDLKEGSLRGESQRQADRIMRDFQTEEDAHDAAKAITNPEVRDLTVPRVDAEWRLKKQTAHENAQAAAAQAKQAIDQTINQMENLIDRRRPVFARDVVPPAIWNNLPHSSREALETYTRRYQEKPAGVDTDVSVYYSLKLKAANEPQDFAKTNLLDYVHKLDKSDLKQLIDLQASIRKGNMTEADKELDGVRTNERIINGTLRQIGIDPDDKTNKARVDQLWNRVDKQVLQLQRDTGKKATNDDIQGIVDRQLIEIGGEPGSWWNILPGGQPFFDQPGKRAFEITIQDVPQADRQQIERALKQSNRPTTEEAILNLYLSTQQRLKKKTGGP